MKEYYFEKIGQELEKGPTYLKYIDNQKNEEKRPQIEEFKNDPDYRENQEKLKKVLNKIKEEEEKLVFRIGKEKAKEIENKSKSFEGFLSIENNKIFGPEVEMIPTSRFDDVFNKIDIVLETKFQNEIIRFGIDASVSNDPQTVWKKEEFTEQQRIKDGKTYIQYFKSILDLNLRGKLENLPRVVIMLSEKQYFFILNDNSKNHQNWGIFFQTILPNLEVQLKNQFLFTLSRNALEIESMHKIKGIRSRKIYQNIINEFYDQARNVLKNKQKGISKLLKFFEDNEKILKLESIILPGRFEFLRNIKNILKWLSDKKEENKIKMFEIFGGNTKETAALFRAAGVQEEVNRYWDTKIFEGLY